MDVKVRIEVEVCGERALKILREILGEKSVEKNIAVDLWGEQDVRIIAEKVFGQKKGRLPRTQVELIKYLYTRGGMAEYKEVARKFGHRAVLEVMKKGATYIGGNGGDKVVVLEDRAKEILDRLYGGGNGEQGAVEDGGEA